MLKSHCKSYILALSTHTDEKGCKVMALPIIILINVLNFNLMHVEKCEEAATTFSNELALPRPAGLIDSFRGLWYMFGL